MKLSDEDVEAIRTAYARGATQASLALRYGVNRAHVWRIVHGLARVPDVLDEVAMERACAGESVPLSVAERREVVRRLSARGWSAKRIAEVVGVTPRSVVRHRAAA